MQSSLCVNVFQPVVGIDLHKRQSFQSSTMIGQSHTCPLSSCLKLPFAQITTLCSYGVFLPVLISVCSSSPTISFSVTRDATFICTATVLQNKTVHKFDSIQLLRRSSVHDEFRNLATQDASGTRQLQSVKRALHQHQVTGSIGQSAHINESRLEVVIGDIDNSDVGTYICQITYTEFPADNASVSWRSREINLPPETADGVDMPGFEMILKTGLHLKCEHWTKGSNISEVSIRQTNALAVWSNNMCNASSSRVICGRSIHSTDRYLFVEAHMSNIDCNDLHAYHCSVETFDGERITSESKELRLDGCVTEVEDKTNYVMISVLVAIGLIVISVVAVGITVYKMRKNKTSREYKTVTTLVKNAKAGKETKQKKRLTHRSSKK